MKRSFDSSFHPRPAVDPGADRQYPSWFLLDNDGRFDNCDNATTAEAKTSTGRTIKFTFCLDPPPAVSHLFVHETDADHEVQAKVVCYAKDLVLLCRENVEYFVYQAAGRGRSKPSLTSIPTSPTTLSWCAAILPLEDGQFLVADLTMDFENDKCKYHLHVFSSKTWVWSTRTLPLRTRRDDLLDEPDKVIALGGSVLGWVVRRAGIVVCDMLGQNPAVHTRFIPLPKPDWGSEEEWRGSLLHFRDVAYCGDDLIKVLDMDLRFRHVTFDSNDRRVMMARDFDHVDTILDSELLPIEDVGSAATVHVPDGWKIRTCYKHISWNYWRKGHVVDVDDISIHNPRHCEMLPPNKLWDEDFRRWTLKKLRVYQTTLSIHGHNVVYLTVVPKEGFRDVKKWIVGIDLGKKTVEMFERDIYGQSDARPFVVSQHLNTPPSVEEIIHAASASRSNHVSSGCVVQNNPRQNMSNAHAYYDGRSFGYADNAQYPGYSYGYNQHPTPWSANLPQALHPNLNSLGSGCIYPVNAQTMYPLHMVNTATHGQQFYSMPSLPPGPAPVLSPSSPFAPPWRPGQIAFRW